MKKPVQLTIIISLIAVGLIIGCTGIKCFCLKKTAHLTPVYFDKGVYKAASPDNKNPDKYYFYIFYDKSSGYTEDNVMGIGLPFSCVQENGYVKFKFGGAAEPDEIFKIKSVKDKVVTGSFDDGSLLIFTPISDAIPDNFDAVEYTKKRK